MKLYYTALVTSDLKILCFNGDGIFSHPWDKFPPKDIRCIWDVRNLGWSNLNLSSKEEEYSEIPISIDTLTGDVILWDDCEPYSIFLPDQIVISGINEGCEIAKFHKLHTFFNTGRKIRLVYMESTKSIHPSFFDGLLTNSMNEYNYKIVPDLVYLSSISEKEIGGMMERFMEGWYRAVRNIQMENKHSF